MIPAGPQVANRKHLPYLLSPVPSYAGDAETITLPHGWAYVNAICEVEPLRFVFERRIIAQSSTHRGASQSIRWLSRKAHGRAKTCSDRGAGRPRISLD